MRQLPFQLPFQLAHPYAERLYDAAALVLSSAKAVRTGASRIASELTSPRLFAATLAGKIAAAAAE
jgi:hypothetical protein